MTTKDQGTGPSRNLGYAILFFGLTPVYAVLAYRLFSNGEMKFGAAIIALMLLMAGTGAYCLRCLLARRRAELEIKRKGRKTTR